MAMVLRRALRLATLAVAASAMCACEPVRAPLVLQPTAPSPSVTAIILEPSPAATVTLEPTPAPTTAVAETTAEPLQLTTMNNLIPKPVSVQLANGGFLLTSDTKVVIDPPTAELTAIGDTLAGLLHNATGYDIQIAPGGGPIPPGSILLTSAAGDPALGDEGYELRVTPEGVVIEAPQPAGVFYGVQTLRQLLPPAIDSASVQPGPWHIPAGTIRDMPRYAWRGFMLDVSRHFFGVDDVKRMIDLASAYKLNRLHLHLTDDQGWRIEIKSWPELTLTGGRTEVGGGEGGFYTQEQYADIVAYAQSRHMTVVPEIDMPGHTNAALASYPELTCDGAAPDLYTGTEVGFSSLCIEKEITYQFLDDVIGELAALTPGPYIHVGGDEAHSTVLADYLPFIGRVEAIVNAHGKQMVGWEEIGQSSISPTSIAQYWAFGHAVAAVKQGAKVIMSPADRIYLDMKYDEATLLGQDWSGHNNVEDAYRWDPAAYVPGIGESDIVGVEAPLWSETLETIDDIEFMAFPRLAGVAELGWSPADGSDWDEYRLRLAEHGPRLEYMGVNFFRSPEVPWP